MNKPLMSAWKTALLALLGAFAVLLVISFSLGQDPNLTPRESGRKFGRQFGGFVIFAPIVAYIVQKSRIDSANRSKPG